MRKARTLKQPTFAITGNTITLEANHSAGIGALARAVEANAVAIKTLAERLTPNNMSGLSIDTSGIKTGE